MPFKKRAIIFQLCLTGIFLTSFLNAQTDTYIHDGYTGMRLATIGNEYLYVFSVVKNGPADKAELQIWDAILSINGNEIVANELYFNQIEEQLYNKAGISYDLLIERDSGEAPFQVRITSEFKPDQIQICNFEYLVDSTGEVTIQDILTDSVQSLFADPNMKRITVHSVVPGGFADTVGILPGDVLIGLYPDMDQSSFNFNLDEGGDGYVLSDMEKHIKVRRDSLEFEVYKPNYVRDLGIQSQFNYDFHAKCYWKKMTFHNRISDNRSYLLSLYNFPDSADLYYVRDSILIESKHFSRDISQREYIYKNNDLIRVDLKRDQIQVFYLRIYKEDSYFLSEDTILPLSLLTELDRIERLLMGSLFGIMIFMALYYLILFLFLRKRNHLFYVFYIVTLTIYIIDQVGYTYESRILDQLYSHLHYPILLTITISFFMFFGMQYLGLKKDLRFWNRMSYWILGIFWLSSLVILAIGLFFPDFKHKLIYSYNISNIYQIILYIAISFLLIPAIICISKGKKTAWYFVVADFILVVLFVFFFKTFDILSFNSYRYPTVFSKVLVQSILPMAATLQFIVFFIGMAHQMRIDDREKKLAQQKIIDQLKENEALKDKVNRELEAKVRERTIEIEEQKEEIETQRDEIEEQRDMLISQNKEITDSINYARRIQEAVLPDFSILDEIMPEYFVLSKPRDVVSGDFYWIREVKNFLVVVAADCTGHGIPGAFMSMLGITLLNEHVSRSKFDTPGEILGRLRKKIKQTLSQEGKIEEQKDGMDMAMVILDKSSRELQYAGAFNPLYLIRKNISQPDCNLENYRSADHDGYCLYEIKADRQPVGIYSRETEFQTKVIKLRDGDTIYIFSDGFADQIGGPEGKKFLSRNFKRSLLSIQEQSMSEQKESLEKSIIEWQNGFDQMDDILVVGIRINPDYHSDTDDK